MVVRRWVLVRVVAVEVVLISVILVSRDVVVEWVDRWDLLQEECKTKLHLY